MIYQNGSSRKFEEDTLPAEPASAEVMSESLLRVIWRGRWLVLIAVVALLAAAVIYLAKTTPIYTSTSRIYVEQSGPRIMKEIAEGVMTQSKNYLYTQAELLKSTPILSASLEKPGISKMRIFERVDNPIQFLKKGLDISVGKKDDIISISSDSPRPAEAAQLVNTVVDSYITYQATTKRSTSAEVLKILQKEKTRASQELTNNLKSMMDYKRQNEELALESEQGNVILQRFQRLSTSLTEAQLATIEAKSAYESAKKMVSDPTTLRQFVEAQQVRYVYVRTERAGLKSKLDELELRRADRLRQLTAGHPAVEAIETEITQVKQQIDVFDKDFANAQVELEQQQYLASKEKEVDIVKYYEEQRKQALDLNDQLAQYTILQSNYEQTRNLCEVIDERIKELNVTEDVGALNISILEVARPADEPSKPQKARILAVALLFSLLLGSGLALLRDWADQRLRSAEEISAVIGVPVLGVVPSMSRRETIPARGQKVFYDSTSTIAEAYKTIRTAVFFSVPKDEAKIVLITSPAAGEGKTTLVSNLAIAMAQAGQRVLIIDADFRRPMVHNIFEVQREPGLSSVLAGQAILDSVIRRTPVEGLDVVPCGPDVANPSEMLNSESFAEIIRELSTRYDRVLVDSPPVIPVTDACILGAISDVILLVLRAEKTTRKSAQQARDGLLSVGGRLLGVVVNDVPRRKGRYGYYYGYGHKYGYGYGQKEKKKAVVAVTANTGNISANG